MKVSDEYTLDLPLVGGVIQPQRRVVPSAVIMRIETYRQACRMAWKLRAVRNLRQRTLAEVTHLYASHVSDYFSVHAETKDGKPRRELPARHVADVERVLGNTVISQWLAQRSQLTVMEELQVDRKQRGRLAA